MLFTPSRRFVVGDGTPPKNARPHERCRAHGAVVCGRGNDGRAPRHVCHRKQIFFCETIKPRNNRRSCHRPASSLSRHLLAPRRACRRPSRVGRGRRHKPCRSCIRSLHILAGRHGAQSTRTWTQSNARNLLSGSRHPHFVARWRLQAVRPCDWWHQVCALRAREDMCWSRAAAALMFRSCLRPQGNHLRRALRISPLQSAPSSRPMVSASWRTQPSDG